MASPFKARLLTQISYCIVLLAFALSVIACSNAASLAQHEPARAGANKTRVNKDLPPNVPSNWTLRFNDNFDGTGQLDVSSDKANWRFESMQDALHRAGNSGIDEHGETVESWDSVRGKRWSAWYDRYQSRNAYREDGRLILGGSLVREADPTRPHTYQHLGTTVRFGDYRLYTVWLDTFARQWVGPGARHIMDPDSPGRIFRYGYFETRVNFSQMQTPGFRVSMWLMPASSDPEGQELLASQAYDKDGNNGVEIDIFEYEWPGKALENRINVAIQGGGAGKRARNVDVSELGMDLRTGYHTLALMWMPDRLVWYINNREIMREDNPALIPDVYSYLILSREMNSGVKNPKLDGPTPGDALERLPYIPRDPGLYAKNIWHYKDNIDQDKAIFDYVRIWQSPDH